MGIRGGGGGGGGVVPRARSGNMCGIASFICRPLAPASNSHPIPTVRTNPRSNHKAFLHTILSSIPTMKRAGVIRQSEFTRAKGKHILSLASSDVKSLSNDASVLFQNLSWGGFSAEPKDERKHLFRARKDTTLAMHRAFAVQALIAVAGLVRLYFALHSGSGGSTSAEEQAANSTSPKVGSVDAAFAAGSCACNLLFAIAIFPVLWLADADFGEPYWILAVSSGLSSLLGLLAVGLAVSFSCRSVTRARSNLKGGGVRDKDSPASQNQLRSSSRISHVRGSAPRSFGDTSSGCDFLCVPRLVRDLSCCGFGAR